MVFGVFVNRPGLLGLGLAGFLFVRPAPFSNPNKETTLRKRKNDTDKNTPYLCMLAYGNGILAGEYVDRPEFKEANRGRLIGRRRDPSSQQIRRRVAVLRRLKRLKGG